MLYILRSGVDYALIDFQKGIWYSNNPTQHDWEEIDKLTTAYVIVDKYAPCMPNYISIKKWVNDINKDSTCLDIDSYFPISSTEITDMRNQHPELFV